VALLNSINIITIIIIIILLQTSFLLHFTSSAFTIPSVSTSSFDLITSQLFCKSYLYLLLLSTPIIFFFASHYCQCTLQPTSEHYFHNSLHIKWSCFLPVAKTENHQNSFPALVEAATNCKVTGLTCNWVIRIVHSFNNYGHNTALGQLSVY
jgi:hypothetical protein